MISEPHTRETAPEAEARHPDSLPNLLKELRDEATMLVRQETALAKTEIKEEINKVFKNIGILIGGALVAFVGLIILMEAISALVTLGLVAAEVGANSIWLGPLIVGIIITVIGAVMAKKGIDTVKNASLKPEKTIDSLKKDQQWTQDKVS